jgi:hypothetical protein
MKSRDTDQDVRDLYLRNAPSVDERETWEAIRERVAAEPRSSRPRRRPLRLVLASVGALVLAAAASVGIYAAVEHVSDSQEVLILGGSPTFEPTGESVAVTSSAGTEVVLSGDEADLYREIQWIREGLQSGTIVLDPDGLIAGLAALEAARRPSQSS